MRKLALATVSPIGVWVGMTAGSAVSRSAGEMNVEALWQCDAGDGWCVSTIARVNPRTGPHINGIAMTMDSQPRGAA